jgi:hypothetical protein
MTTTTFVDQTTVVAADWLNDVDAAVYQAQSGITSSTDRTAVSKFSDFVSVKDFGATGDGVADDTAEIQAAITACSVSGKALHIPAGTYKLTTKLTIPDGCNSIFGDGNTSILRPTGVDGIEFTNQATYAGSRVFRNFLISGSSTSAKKGIIANMTAASGDRCTGVVLDSVGVENFEYAADLRGFWNCTFRSCFFYNNYQGVLLSNRNIKTTFENCHIVAGAITGSGTRTGISAVLETAVRSESILVLGCYIYGYEVGVSFGNVLYASVINCDIDNTTSVGVEAVTVNGGLTIAGCWINLTGAAATPRGVSIPALGTLIADKIVVTSNNISLSASTAGSIGVYAGNNHITSVENNRVDGFETGVTSVAADTSIKYNSINATTTAISLDSSSSVDNDVGPNYIEAGTAVAFSSGAAVPAGLKYWAKGQYTLALTGCTAGVDATVDWVSHGSAVTLSISADATGTSNTTAMTGTGTPQALWPASARSFQAACVDNGVGAMARAAIAAATGVITFSKNLDAAAFTNSGTKGLRQSTMTYMR